MSDTIVRLLIGLLLIMSMPAMPADNSNSDVLFNQVHLDASAEREIDNDLLEVILVVEVQGQEPGRIVNQVNETMDWALQHARAESGIEVQTLSYRTYPVYRNQVVAAWRATQQLSLKSRRITELSELTGELQERLQVQSMRFSMTPEARREVENELVGEAMQAFRQRVQAVSEHMQGREYRIVNLHINSGHPGPVMYQERAMAMGAADMDRAPAVEAGTSRVTVTVSGSVQFY